jgi:hypothetical protein
VPSKLFNVTVCRHRERSSPDFVDTLLCCCNPISGGGGGVFSVPTIESATTTILRHVFRLAVWVAGANRSGILPVLWIASMHSTNSSSLRARVLLSIHRDFISDDSRTRPMSFSQGFLDPRVTPSLPCAASAVPHPVDCHCPETLEALLPLSLTGLASGRYTCPRSQTLSRSAVRSCRPLRASVPPGLMNSRPYFFRVSSMFLPLCFTRVFNHMPVDRGNFRRGSFGML